MKKYILLMMLIAVLHSCSEAKKQNDNTANDSKVIIESGEKRLEDSSGEVEAAFEQLEGLLNTSNKDHNDNKKDKLPEVEAFEKLLQLASTQTEGNEATFKEMLSSGGILEMLEAGGVSREELEKLINNPDSLAILAVEARKKREVLKEIAMGDLTQGKLSNGQLTSKTNPTGVSLEEALLLVQAESGIKATIEKLKQVDSLAGTKTMEQLDLETAQKVFNAVEQRKNVVSSQNEKEKIDLLRKRSTQIHSDKEAITLLKELEQTEAAIASGEIEASSRYKRFITNRRKTVKIYGSAFKTKSKKAMNKFRKLNPDLYFGEEAGTTYVGAGIGATAVYLPLGKLAFADKVISANHPKGLTNNRNDAIGEPDVLYGYEVEDVTGIYSLGDGGDLTVQFIDNALTNVNGPDLYIFEYGTIEPTDLEISKDGVEWIRVGKIEGGVAEVDIADFAKPGELFYYVRLKDLMKTTSLPGADIDAIAAIGAAMRLNLDSKVLFETGKAELKPEGIDALKALAQSIAVLKRGNVIIEGHTDDVGSEATNQKLSLARAKSVSTELIKLIPGTGFKWTERGLGESKPLVKNDSDKNRAKNRRVEIIVLPN